jgi:hypothetical protein
MRANEGMLDRSVRIVVGLALLIVLTLGPVPGWGLWGFVGLAPLATGITGVCPTYALLGINTRRRERSGAGRVPGS